MDSKQAAALARTGKRVLIAEGYPDQVDAWRWGLRDEPGVTVRILASAHGWSFYFPGGGRVDVARITPEQLDPNLDWARGGEWEAANDYALAFPLIRSRVRPR